MKKSSKPKQSRVGLFLTYLLALLGYAATFFTIAVSFTWKFLWLPMVVIAPVLFVAILPKSMIIRTIARLLLLIPLGFAVYQAISLGYMLYWTIPDWVLIVVAFLFIASVLTSFRGGFRIPFVFSLGVFILLCINGWNQQKWTVRCTDFLDAANQEGVKVIAPSDRRFDSCSSGDTFKGVNHPRMIYHTNDPGRYLVSVETADQVDNSTNQDLAFSGGICELDEDLNITCGDYSKITHLAYEKATDKVYATGPIGLFKMESTPPFKVENQIPGRKKRFPAIAVLVPKEPYADLALYFDNLSNPERIDSSTFERLEVISEDVSPEDYQYDSETGEGLYCYASTVLFPTDGTAFLALAFDKEDLLKFRPIGTSKANPWVWLGFSDGCALDTAKRRAWSSVGTLGLITEMDYDSGAILASHFVGFGVRSILMGKDRMYVSNYLNGRVSEYDLGTWELKRSWFAGRFIRHVQFNHNQTALLVTSTLGITEIGL
ncbi:MAG: YncE family protein [Myxococcota bacterium]|jgi:hypothetical protein|nr:hypothetical protein [Myxococcota bacterium]OQC39802.1 MAG: hypothetical protein BWX66_01082 [Deltaproteobacteria bacterium ADurb.Bin058]HHW97593.1 hypothetical protein [Oligoflexales bacterium]